MANDPNQGEGAKTPRPEKSIPDETVEEVKRTVLYEVGYKRPPKETRFKKGQSGNPKGRPKSYDLGLGNSRSANAIALKEGERPISVREGAETREMSAIDAVFRKQLTTALGGNAYAQKQVIERYHWAECEERERRLRSIEFWETYQKQNRQEINEAKNRKEVPPSPPPHPDDIVIDYEKGVQFKGPIDEEGLARLEEAIKMRDVLIMQHELDQREIAANEANPDEGPGMAMLIATLINFRLPERVQLSVNDFVYRELRYRAIPKRRLLKELYRAWREIGVHRPRGYVFPPLGVGKRAVKWVNDLMDHVRQGGDPADVPFPGARK